MSNAYDEFEFETPEEKPVSEGGTLRKKLEGAIELLKAKDKEIAELNKFRTESTVNGLLKDIPERFHKLAKSQLTDNPTSEGLNAFVSEYGDLWGAEVEEPNAEEAQLRQALERVNAATREGRNTKEEPFKMPSAEQLARMPISEVNKLMEQAKAQYKV